MYDIPCILFAGGRSSRMGENKALLPFANAQSLTQYQYERLKELFEKVYIGTKKPELFNHIDAFFIDESEHPDVFAPTVGFVSAFKQLKEESHLLVLSVDAPFVNNEIFDALAEFKESDYDAIIVRTASGTHPMCGLYSRSLEATLQKMLKEDNHKLGQMLKNAKVHYIDIEDEELLTNVNTQDEYQKALKILKGEK